MTALAQVAVENTVYHFDKLFTYRVPEALLSKAAPGVRVMVPFGAGNRERVGMVFALGGEESENLKSVAAVLDREPVLSRDELDLVRWMKDRYYCTWFEAVKLMIPAGLQLRLKDSYVLSSTFTDFDRENYDSLSWQIIMALRSAGRAVSLEKLGLGITRDCPEFRSLLDRGIVCKVNLAMNRVRDAVSKAVRPILDFSGRLTPRQKEVYQVLLDAGEVSEKELCYFTGASSSVIKALVEKGAAEVFQYEVYRRPETAVPKEQPEPELSEGQQEVYESLVDEYENAEEGSRCALLYGVTGSGKTSVFLKLIRYVLDQGRGVIVMVPEISLTPQTLRQFQQLFGGQVALFHSGLSLGERMDEWKRVRRGEARIAVGTRSAVFAPVRDLGLIVVDEEQEHTYKSESSPRYDAREVARYRCAQSEAFCLLCSATPSVETFRMAKEGKFRFHKLEDRFGQAQLPEVDLVDMNEEDYPGSEQAIGMTLGEALIENYNLGRQSIVLLNRRGYHTFASCRSCQEVVSCPNCSISLTYHTANRRLMCHYCGYSVPLMKKCPSCGSESLAFRGLGTQKAEEQLKELLPEARILRVDTDSMSGRYSLERSLEEFAQGRYDVMVGTQMVAKGLDFENVTLVGVISVDQALYSDDFRSNERAFDLLTQVVGRAGRGRLPGRAVIQTYVPENPVLHLAAEQDYFGFAQRELAYRKALLYPPFVDLLVIGFVGGEETLTRRAAERFLQELSRMAEKDYRELPLRVLRPSPAAVAKVSGKYRYKLIIKCRNGPRLREMTARLLTGFAEIREFQQVTVYADPNPDRII